MKLQDGRITIRTSKDEVTIEFIDYQSNRTFAQATLTPEQFTQALSRLAYTECTMEVFDLDTVGKTMEHQQLEFPLPEDTCHYDNNIATAKREIFNHLPEGWVPDLYFGSKDSFFTGAKGRLYARTTIRRWV